MQNRKDCLKNRKNFWKEHEQLKYQTLLAQLKAKGIDIIHLPNKLLLHRNTPREKGFQPEIFLYLKLNLSLMAFFYSGNG
ncbi:hypothetical protein U9R62_10970 [Cylindrospermopsis raciborskii DSH]|uniref:hypothetical protein n=1 Tax=Cylindrospermopsis raciborskii TaxID=77022 RepID=UPI002ED774AD